ncbi:Chromo shadow domain containing protein [Trichuris trichiura]|uniref:Chromo shadow domain containing protein n=1 Tax=Trichuris trichiura TaxID=36087 RepID=A0A077YZK5_TRITR|nr:Chromo shadow domain containing protein [Trichuris trichiura]
MSTRPKRSDKADNSSDQAKSESGSGKVGKAEGVDDCDKAIDDCGKIMEENVKNETSTSAVAPSQDRVLRPRGFRRNVKELFSITQYCMYTRHKKRHSNSSPKVIAREPLNIVKKRKLTPIPEEPETPIPQEEPEVGPSSSGTEKPEDMLPSNGFERGLTVEAIIAALDITGDKMFLVKFKNQEQLELIPLSTAKRLCPYVVVAFYEARLRLQWIQDNSASHILSMDDET